MFAPEDPERALQVVGVFHRVAGLVALGVELRRRHVSLGVDRVVVVPLAHRTARHRGMEHIRMPQDRHDRRQRCAHLMAHIRKKLRFKVIQLLQIFIRFRQL